MQRAILRGKKILITAGPTWIPIDKVRVISNIATGKTGILLAKQANRLRADVTLLLGPIGDVNLDRAISIKRFYYFNELHSLIKRELKTKKYDIFIHSAAVSDYKPKQAFSEKLKSNIKNLTLELETTVKIVDKIKKYDPNIFLVIFKLELGLSINKMIEKARKTMQESKADLAVVNTFTPLEKLNRTKGISLTGFTKKYPYNALIIDRKRIFYSLNSKEELIKKLLEIISFQSN